MSVSVYLWLLAGHLIGVFLWVGGLFSTYWLLRIHAQAPKDVHEKLTLMERSLALVMDLAATLAIVTGLVMALTKGGTHPATTMFGAPHAGWFHTKVTLVVLGILPVHGIIRGRIGKFGRGQVTGIPQWLWSLLLAAICGIAILVVRRPF
ncbi:MAG TPA: CopD family protein [Kofleriaceae bacterium]|nr:CopD family protein [Kofleriaceae bacterium]